MCPNCGGSGVWQRREDGNNECEVFDTYRCQNCGNEWDESKDICEGDEYEPDEDGDEYD